MNRILNILKWEFMVRFRSKIFLISLFMPLILVVFSIVPAMLMEKGGDSEVKVGIVNHARHITTDFKLNIERKYRLDDEKPKYWFFDYENFDEAKAGLLKKTLDVVMVIPAGIMDTANAEFYARSLSNFKVMDELRNTLSHTVILMRMSEQGVAVEMAESISKRVRMEIGRAHV